MERFHDADRLVEDAVMLAMYTVSLSILYNSDSCGLSRRRNESKRNCNRDYIYWNPEYQQKQ